MYVKILFWQNDLGSSGNGETGIENLPHHRHDKEHP
jgi:hypothetical protein